MCDIYGDLGAQTGREGPPYATSTTFCSIRTYIAAVTFVDKCDMIATNLETEPSITSFITSYMLPPKRKRTEGRRKRERSGGETLRRMEIESGRYEISFSISPLLRLSSSPSFFPLLRRPDKRVGPMGGKERGQKSGEMKSLSFISVIRPRSNGWSGGFINLVETIDARREIHQIVNAWLREVSCFCSAWPCLDSA